MSQPIKISDELYQRLKERAHAEGLTLQDALVELITTPHEGLNKLQVQLRESRDAVSSQRQLHLKLKEQIEQLRKRVDVLHQLREKDVKAFNDWSAIWETINPLAEDVKNLTSRVCALETVSHRHIGQTVKEES